MSAFLLLWFVLLHAWAFCTVGRRGFSFGAYVSNLVAIILLAVLTLRPDVAFPLTEVLR